MQAVRQWLAQRETAQLICLLMGGLLLRGTIAAWLPPGFDEGYYYLYTQNLSWSYFDHPLLVALTTGFGPWLTGGVSQLTIRLGALLLYTGSLLLLYLTAARLFSSKVATMTLAIASIIPIFLLGFGTLTLPDSPLMFFWTAAMYVAVGEFFPDPAQRTDDPSYCPSYRLAIVGLLVGLACLGKYHGLALGFGLIGFCLTHSRYRSALWSRWAWIGFGLFILAILPIVVWNAQHDWISLRFQSGRAIPGHGYSLLDFLATFLIGVCYLFPSFGFPLWWATGQAVLQQIRREQLPRPTPHAPLSTPHATKIRFILWLTLPLMAGFTLMGGYRPILPTWAAPGFWGATLLLGEYAVRWQLRSPRLVRRWLWSSGLIIVALLLVVLSHVAVGTLQKPSRYALLGGFLPVETDASVQLIDIQQLRMEFAQSPELTSALTTTDFIFTKDIYLAGQVGMALVPLAHKPITCFDEDLRGFAFWSTQQQWVGQSGLLIVPQPAAIAQYTDYFEQIQKIADVPIRRGGAIVQILQVYQCTNLLKPYPRPYG